MKIPQQTGPLRRDAYDPPGEQLDAIWKGLEALAEGKPLPPETVEALERWRAVKNRFPKRER